MGENFIMTSFTAIFDSVKQYCTENKIINDTAMRLWIEPLIPIELEENSAIFSISSEFQKGVIIKNYEKILTEAFKSVIGFDVQIVINIDDEEETKAEMYAAENRKAELENIFEGAKYDYTFDTFIVGRSNEFAYAACSAVAGNKSSAPTYNPLFIYGPSGLGKTHLLTAIAHAVKKNNADANIVYVTGESFANELISAIHQKKDTSQFHQKYRSADVLLVDDVQFIAGKESTQEEFFHTFNELHKIGKQIVLTSDRPPKDIKTLEERIRTRFEWGLIADITYPDFETRIAIIKRKAELLNLTIPNDVCEFIANRLKTNIRQLEGAVKKLKASKHLLGTAITISMAQSVIKDILTDSQPIPVTVENIITEVANTYNVTSDDIRSTKRNQQITAARKVAIYCIREITNLSQDAIGKELGGRDHSTITYSLTTFESALKKDAHLKEIVDDIIKNIRDK